LWADLGWIGLIGVALGVLFAAFCSHFGWTFRVKPGAVTLSEWDGESTAAAQVQNENMSKPFLNQASVFLLNLSSRADFACEWIIQAAEIAKLEEKLAALKDAQIMSPQAAKL